MAYTDHKLRSRYRLRQDDALMTRDQIFGSQEAVGQFHEYEPAVVLYVIHDNDDPAIVGVPAKTANSYEWPLKADGTEHSNADPDYSWVGRARVRMVFSEQGVNQEQLNWAQPLEKNSEFPLVNEVVQVIKLFNHYYYTKSINTKNMPHHNADFRYEERYGIYGGATSSLRPYGDTNSYTLSFVANGAISKEADKVGALGAYYKSLDLIRPLKHFEGDTVIESRFGSSLRMGGYGTTLLIDPTTKEPRTDPRIDSGSGQYDGGYGNPCFILRNRQRFIDSSSKANIFYYRITEDINNDGSEIAMTSGRTISAWTSTCEKGLFQSTTQEEQPLYSPSGSTTYAFPQATYDPIYNDTKYLIGDQTIVNTDRIIMQSRKNETLFFSKRRFGVVTDDEFTVDSHKQQVFTSNTKTVFNSPYIFLGEYNQTKEPALLGQTTIEWLYDLCEVLKAHTHWYKHVHVQPDTGPPVPLWTQQPIQQFIDALDALEQRLPLLCSQRVFLTGGGHAVGADGGSILGGTQPGTLKVAPGGYYVPNPGSFAGHISSTSVKQTLLPAAE